MNTSTCSTTWLACLTFALMLSLRVMPIYAQSPRFPNTRPITINPFGSGPYGSPYGNTIPGWGAGNLVLRPLPAVYSQPLPTPAAGYRTYNYIVPYGNSPNFPGNYSSGY